MAVVESRSSRVAGQVREVLDKGRGLQARYVKQLGDRIDLVKKGLGMAVSGGTCGTRRGVCNAVSGGGEMTCWARRREGRSGILGGDNGRVAGDGVLVEKGLAVQWDGWKGDGVGWDGYKAEAGRGGGKRGS